MPTIAKSSPAAPAVRTLQATPTLSPADREALTLWEERLRVIGDRVRGAALGYATGFYLAGRAGTGKTHTVRQTLDELETPYHYHTGHLTSQGLFELLARYHDRVLVLDDMASILGQAVALQYLLAALGLANDGSRSRPVRYGRQDESETVYFTGSLIAISNLELHDRPLLEALKSRVPYLLYDPSDGQMTALLRSLAAKGWESNGLVLSSEECSEVAEHVIAESVRLNVRLDLRTLVGKALPDYLQYREGDADTHWRDLVTASLQERLVDLTHTASAGPSPKQVRLAAEREIAKEIRAEFPNAPRDQVAAWEDRTGQSRSSYYRRLE